MTDVDAPIAYQESDHWVYRASSLGHCLNALTAALLGYEPRQPPARLQEVYDSGHVAEGECIDALTQTDPETGELGWFIHDCQKTVELWVDRTNLIRGHIDGLVGTGAELTLLEIKSQSDEEWSKWSEDSWTTNPLWVTYGWQVSTYMHALRLPAVVVRWNRDSKVYKLVRLKSPIKTFKAIQARIVSVNQEWPGCKGEGVWGCPYFYLHDGPEETDDPELAELTERYLSQKRIRDSVAAELDKTRAAILAHVGAEPLKQYLRGGPLVTTYLTTTRRWDWTAMREDIPNLERYVTATSTLALKVTERDAPEVDEIAPVNEAEEW